MSSLILHVSKLIRAFCSKPENSNVFVDPMLKRPLKELALAETVKSCRALFRRWPVGL